MTQRPYAAPAGGERLAELADRGRFHDDPTLDASDPIPRDPRIIRGRTPEVEGRTRRDGQSGVAPDSGGAGSPRRPATGAGAERTRACRFCSPPCGFVRPGGPEPGRGPVPSEPNPPRQTKPIPVAQRTQSPCAERTQFLSPCWLRGVPGRGPKSWIIHGIRDENPGAPNEANFCHRSLARRDDLRGDLMSPRRAKPIPGAERTRGPRRRANPSVRSRAGRGAASDGVSPTCQGASRYHRNPGPRRSPIPRRASGARGPGPTGSAPRRLRNREEHPGQSAPKGEAKDHGPRAEETASCALQHQPPCYARPCEHAEAASARRRGPVRRAASRRGRLP